MDNIKNNSYEFTDTPIGGLGSHRVDVFCAELVQLSDENPLSLSLLQMLLEEALVFISQFCSVPTRQYDPLDICLDRKEQIMVRIGDLVV